MTDLVLTALEQESNMETMSTATIDTADDVETPGTTIRGFRVDDDLWERAKAKAKRSSKPGHKVTMTDVLVRAVVDFVNTPEGE